MVEVGLIPSDTGEPGGKPTGQKKMSHYIDPTGKFIQAVHRMPKDVILPWRSASAPRMTRSRRSPERRSTFSSAWSAAPRFGAKNPTLTLLTCLR